MTQPRHHYSLDDYFAVEQSSPIRHEYLDGEILAMAGASLAHNDISANVLAILRTALRGAGCRAFGSDLRIVTPTGLYTYPDVSVICGPPALVPGRPDTVSNPILLVEVLSAATRDYDRGDKLTAYETIPALREVLLVDQEEVAVEWRHRTDTGVWMSEAYRALDGVVRLSSIPTELALADVYREVFGPSA